MSGSAGPEKPTLVKNDRPLPFGYFALFLFCHGWWSKWQKGEAVDGKVRYAQFGT